MSPLQNFLRFITVGLMTEPPDYREPLPTELEQCEDEARADVGLGPVPRDPRQGIRDMQARIRYHQTLLAKFRRQLTPRTRASRRQTLQRLIADSEHQVRDAQNRLAEYQAQLSGRN